MDPVGPLSDAALWALAKDGQLSAFGRVLRRHEAEVGAAIRGRYGVRAPAAEILAAAFLALWRSRDSLEAAENAAVLVATRVASVLDTSGGSLLARASGDGVAGAGPVWTTAAAGPADPTEAALLYFGAGLPMTTVSTVLDVSPDDVIAALQRYQAGTRAVLPASHAIKIQTDS